MKKLLFMLPLALLTVQSSHSEWFGGFFSNKPSEPIEGDVFIVPDGLYKFGDSLSKDKTPKALNTAIPDEELMVHVWATSRDDGPHFDKAYKLFKEEQECQNKLKKLIKDEENCRSELEKERRMEEARWLEKRYSLWHLIRNGRTSNKKIADIKEKIAAIEKKLAQGPSKVYYQIYYDMSQDMAVCGRERDQKYKKYEEEHDKSKKSGKSDNWASHGHLKLDNKDCRFPDALPYSMLEKLKEGEEFDLEVCGRPVTLRARQDGYRYGSCRYGEEGYFHTILAALNKHYDERNQDQVVEA